MSGGWRVTAQVIEGEVTMAWRLYASSWDPAVRASSTSAPVPGRAVVVQEQRLVLDPAGTQDSGVVATIGAFVPVWSPSAHEVWGP